MPKDKNVIVIILYKEEPSLVEKKSFEQCFKIFKNRKIYIVQPKNINLANYFSEINTKNINYTQILLENIHFKNVEAYNNLMLSPFFYELFKAHEYILVYQLDAWVFNDELDYWCDLGYSYIGAPWFEGFSAATVTSPMLDFAGNGGFSLRHIKSSVKLLEMHWPWLQYYVVKKLLDASHRNLFFEMLRRKKYVSNVFKATRLNEDYLFAKYGCTLCHTFSVAPTNIARSFSFEVNPSLLYKLNNEKLPFGCHAFEKYDTEFWHDKIKV